MTQTFYQRLLQPLVGLHPNLLQLSRELFQRANCPGPAKFITTRGANYLKGVEHMATVRTLMNFPVVLLDPLPFTLFLGESHS